MLNKYIIGLAFIVSLPGLSARAQQSDLIKKVEKHLLDFPPESIYLSLDKPNYLSGDTIWFKTVLLNAGTYHAGVSEKVYVELFNDSTQMVQQRVILLNNGLGYGDIALDNDIGDGRYILRAYTNWQQNFGSECFFEKQLYIGNATNKTWLVDAWQQLITANNQRTADIKLKLSNAKNELAGFREVRLTLMNGANKVNRTDMSTAADGSLSVKFDLPGNTSGNWSLLISDKKDPARNATLPLTIGNEDTDLQFMPEGGYLVNGISSKVAFKAIGNNGLGKTVSGSIVNSNNEQVATFKSEHNGMGSFFLFPQPGQQYTAVFDVNGKENRLPLKPAREQGTTLKIEQFVSPDSVLLYLKASPLARKDNYQVIAQAAEKIVVAFKADLTNGFFNLKVPKSTFPDGIIHFTLFSPEAAPLNERAMLINHAKKLNISIAAAKDNYGTRDSVAVELTATDENGKPLQGAFAVAVTDNNQVNLVKEDDNIISHFLLTGGVKGYVENAGWYFQGDDGIRRQALDNLLLSQGWTGYHWETLQTAAQPAFKAEKASEINGQLTSLFKKARTGINLTLLSFGKTMFVTDTVSGEDGKFSFKDLPLTDTINYVIKIKKPSGTVPGATINVDEFFMPAASATPLRPVTPWYVTTADTMAKKQIAGAYAIKEKLLEKMAREAIAIKEVTINSLSPNFMYKVSINAHLDLEINEAKLKKVPRKSLMEMIWEMEGYKKTRPNDVKPYYIPKFPFNVKSLRMDTIAARPEDYLFLANYLNAEDVKNIKIFKDNNWGMGPAYYLEVTTRSGKGPFMGRSPGVYVYRPLPVYLGREFYSPKYLTDSKADGTDLRSTLFWNANVVTDEKGKARFYFYTADKSATYTIKAEGTDMDGRFGFQLKEISVKETTLSK